MMKGAKFFEKNPLVQGRQYSPILEATDTDGLKEKVKEKQKLIREKLSEIEKLLNDRI